MSIHLRRRTVCALSALPLAGCTTFSTLAPTNRRMPTPQANPYSYFSLRASPDRKLFVIDEIRSNSDGNPSQPRYQSQLVAEAPEPVRYILVPPESIRRVPNDAPLPSPLDEVAPDPRKLVGFAYHRDSNHQVIHGKVKVEDKILDTGKLWTRDAQLNADLSRIYLITGVRPVGLFGRNYPYGYYLDIFDAATGARIGNSLHLAWENVDSTPRVRTYDNEKILFVTGWPQPDVAIYMPHEWPSRK
ncbi:MAG: hypothetical protein ACOVOT_06740 [Rubrivivax sp.]|jgi:hypothetical protein